MAASLGGRDIMWGDDNTFKQHLVSRGDVDAAWAEAEIVVEGEYETGAQGSSTSSRTGCSPTRVTDA